MKVDIIIIGGQKCGTTALFEFLTSHPKIHGSEPKELDFFNYKARFSKGIKNYHSNFPIISFPKRITGHKFIEASPTYLTDNNVEITAKRIYNYNRKIKIIALVRDPVERAYSAWNMYKDRYERGMLDWWYKWMEDRTGQYPMAISRKSEEFSSFTYYIQNELKALEKGNAIEGEILSKGNYSKGIEIFKKEFGKNFHIVKNEDLNENTVNQLKQISKFLYLQDYDWEKFKKTKIFKGNYLPNNENQAIELLKGYYKKSNEELFNLTGIDYRKY